MLDQHLLSSDYDPGTGWAQGNSQAAGKVSPFILIFMDGDCFVQRHRASKWQRSSEAKSPDAWYTSLRLTALFPLSMPIIPES